MGVISKVIVCGDFKVVEVQWCKDSDCCDLYYEVFELSYYIVLQV